MQKRYIFLAFILIALSTVLALLPERHNCKNDQRAALHLKSKSCNGITAEELLLNSLSTYRYMDVDELAAVVIGEDPSYILVDIRDEKQYAEYSLPGAVNIPYESILDSKNASLFKSNVYKKVLISNGTLLSDQAWILLRRNDYKEIKVLDGGLNSFFETLMNPPLPKETDSNDEFEKYSFRKAAGVYFGLPNPKDFIPELVLALKNQREKGFISRKSSNLTKKSVNLEKRNVGKKIIINEEKEEEDEGC